MKKTPMTGNNEKEKNKKPESFDKADFITLDLINRDIKLPDWAKSRLPKLRKSRVIERVGRKNILSRHCLNLSIKKVFIPEKRRSTGKLTSNCC